MATLEELFEALKEGKRIGKTLPNTKETWIRIGLKDDFAELGFTSESEKEKFLQEWISENEYANI